MGRDRGDTLVELLVSIAIMGIVAVAVFGALLTSVKVSDYHRKQTNAGTDVHNFAEAVTAHTYKACALTTDFPTTGPTPVYAAPNGYTATTASVAYWTTTSTWATSGCTTANDTGIERITIKVASNDVRATETLQVVVRQP